MASFSFEDASTPAPATGTPSSFSFEEASQPPASPLAGIAKQSVGMLGGLMDIAGTIGEVSPLYQAAKTGAYAYNLGRTLSGSTEPPVRIPTGGELIKRAYGTVGLNPDEIAKPQNASERIARAGFEALPWAVTGGGDILAAPSLLSAAGRAAAEVGTNIAAGAGGQAAAEAVPEGYKPVATIAGSLIGGGATAGAIAGARGTGQAISRFRQPLTAEGQETLAGQVLRQRAENPERVLATLSGEGAPEGAASSVVPGSKPTTFQLTGDMGLGSLEREAATRDPAAFMARRAEQNAARLDTLGGIQSEGAPQAVSAALDAQLRAIDTDTQQSIDRTLTEAQGRAAGLGGAGTPETHGAALRDALMAAENTARENERGLWTAVDPDRTLAVGVTPVQQAAAGIYGDLTHAAHASMTPSERQIVGVVSQYRDVEPFREITDLRSLVSSAMREELSTAGRTPTYARLSQLRGAIEGSIDSGVQERLARDAEAVRAGTMRPEDTVAARIIQWRDEWRQRTEAGLAGSAVGAAGNVRPLPGAAGDRVPRLGGAQADLGVAGRAGPAEEAPLAINFDPGAAARLAEASAATRERAQTFAPFKSVMRREGQQGPFRLPESAVPAKIFHPGPTGAEDVANFRQAVGDTAALPLLRDYAAHSVRQAALSPDGTIDPARFARWQAAHSEAMRAFPDLAGHFSDAARATESIGQAAAIRRDALNAAQQGVLGKLINARDPADVTRIVGGIFGARDAVTQMRNLVGQVRDNPAAMEGLRKAIADHVMGKLVSNTEAAASGRNLIKSDQFQTFVRQNAPALREVFTPDEVGMMQAVADDLNRANRSVTAVKLPGQSNTAQDITALRRGEAAQGESLFSKMIKIHSAEEAGRLGGATAGALFGPIGAWVGSTLGGFVGMAAQQFASAARSAGLHRVNDLVREAMLHPEIARGLMQKAATPQQEAHVLRTLARRLGTISMYGAQAAQRRRGGRIPHRDDGGPVYDPSADPWGAPSAAAGDVPTLNSGLLERAYPAGDPYSVMQTGRTPETAAKTLGALGDIASSVPPVSTAINALDAFGRGLVATGRGEQDPEAALSVASSVMGGGLGRAPVPGEAVFGSGPIRAYHGSPHDFGAVGERPFDISKVGTGEGAQAYGHGMYFAESEGTARSYRDQLSGSNNIRPDDEAIAAIKPQWDETVAQLRAARERSNDRMTDETSALQNKLDALNDHAIEDTLARKPWLKQGRMYEVGIHADRDKFLDWDNPLSQQPAALAAIDRMWRALGEKPPEKLPNLTGAGGTGYLEGQMGPEGLAKALREAGIPGIKYYDQGSRGGVGVTRNFVVFDPSIVEVLRKYGIAGLVSAGVAHAAMQAGDEPKHAAGGRVLTRKQRVAAILKRNGVHAA